MPQDFLKLNFTGARVKTGMAHGKISATAKSPKKDIVNGNSLLLAKKSGKVKYCYYF